MGLIFLLCRLLRDALPPGRERGWLAMVLEDMLDETEHRTSASWPLILRRHRLIATIKRTMD